MAQCRDVPWPFLHLLLVECFEAQPSLLFAGYTLWEAPSSVLRDSRTSCPHLTPERHYRRPHRAWGPSQLFHQAPTMHPEHLVPASVSILISRPSSQPPCPTLHLPAPNHQRVLVAPETGGAGTRDSATISRVWLKGASVSHPCSRQLLPQAAIQPWLWLRIPCSLPQLVGTQGAALPPPTPPPAKIIRTGRASDQ